jgi:aquaporin NIP
MALRVLFRQAPYTGQGGRELPRPARMAAAEFFGTYLLVFAGPGAIVINEVSGGQVTSLGVGLSFGLAVMGAIVAFGAVSGAHINPAVSLAFAARGSLSWPLVPLSVGAQLAGAAAAAATLRALFGNVAGLGATVPSDTALQALVLEGVLTFFLMSVILGATSEERADTRSAGLAIGAYVGLAAVFAGPIAGASMNPARSFGPALLSGVWDDHWAFWLGPLAGALLASLAFSLLRPAGASQEEERVK